MEVECPVGNVVGSVEQVGLFVCQWYVYLLYTFSSWWIFSQSMSLFTPTYTVHDGAGNEKFVVEVNNLWRNKPMSPDVLVNSCFVFWLLTSICWHALRLLTSIHWLTSIAFVDIHFDCWHAFVCWHQFVDKQFWLLTCRDPRQSLASSRAAIAARHAMSSSGAQICSKLLKFDQICSNLHLNKIRCSNLHLNQISCSNLTKAHLNKIFNTTTDVWLRLTFIGSPIPRREGRWTIILK